MNAVTITLPLPPLPLSQCFINVGRSRTSSPAYKAWKRDCDTHLMAFHNYARGKNGKPAIPGLVKVDIALRPKKGRKPDVDNCLKATCDLLTRNLVIEDDSKIIDLRIRWGQFDMEHNVVIEVEKA